MTMLCGFFSIFLAVLTWRESGVSGELTLLESEPYRISDDSDRMARKLTCTSDDDLSALVWNEDLKYYEIYKRRAAFVDSSTERSPVDCYFEFLDDCIHRWDAYIYWQHTYGQKFFMGPLMNSRWEDSYDKLCLGDWECGVDMKKLVESWRVYVRGTDLTFVGCPLYGNRYKSLCGEFDVRKEIGKRTKPELGSRVECRNTQVFQKSAESFLSRVEWRTLTFKYDENETRVTVYDEVEEIMSCRFDDSSWWRYFMLRGSNGTLLRFNEDLRKDGYIYTKQADRRLLSPWINVLGSNICIEMLIGLCTGCEASVEMTSEKQSILMGVVIPKSRSNGDGTRPWQHVRFNKSVQDGFGSRVRFQVVTHLSKGDPHPLWAVANVKLCKDDDAVRTSTMESRQVWNEEQKEYVWPEVACQKLSHHGGSLVRSTLPTQGEGKPGLPNNKESTNPNLVWLIAIPIVAALALLAYRKRNVILAKSNDNTTSVTQDRANSIIRTSFHASSEDETLMDQTQRMSPQLRTIQK